MNSIRKTSISDESMLQTVERLATRLIDFTENRFETHATKKRQQREQEHELAITLLNTTFTREQEKQRHNYALEMAEHNHQIKLAEFDKLLADQIELSKQHYKEAADLLHREHQLRLAQLQQELTNHQTLEKFKLRLSLIGLSNNLSIQKMFATYPDSRGPGRLRAGLSMLPEYNSNRKVIPPLVLIPPPESDGSIDYSATPLWQGFRSIIQYSLGRYSRQLHVPPLYPDRPFSWPNDAFYVYDLIGLPTIVVKTAVTPYSLNVFIGGCHLTSFDSDNILALQPALRLRLRKINEKILLLDHGQANFSSYLSTTSSDTQNNMLLPEVTEDELVELAAKAIHLCVVKLMDIYYLTVAEHYDEQFDSALATEGVSYSAEFLSIDLPSSLVCDLPYHELHQFARFSQLGEQYDYHANLHLERALRELCVRGDALGEEQDIEQRFYQLLGSMLDGQRVPDSIVLHLRKLLDILEALSLNNTHRKLLLPPLEKLRNTKRLPYTATGGDIV